MSTTSMSTYTGGFANGVTIRNMPLLNAYPGKVFWVSSTSGGNGKGTFERPFNTIAQALAVCTAGRGDIIIAKPLHAETISSATGLLMNVAGVAVVGLGSGTNRPTFTFSTANTATIAVSAANVSFINCRFVANFLSIAAPLTLSTAASFTVQGCTFKDNSGVLDFLNCVKSTGAANTVDSLYFVDNVWSSLGTTSVNTAVLTANDIDGLVFARNRIVQVTTVDQAIGIVVTAGVLTNLWCAENIGYRKNTTTASGSLINVGGVTSTGFVVRNYVQTLTTAADKLFTTTVGLAAFENRVTGAVGATGFVIPAADS